MAHYSGLGLSFEWFGRTSSPQNRDLTQHFLRKLDANGLLAERDVDLPWSGTDGRFLPDRYVLGTCPRCGDPDARGDQCDVCGALLDPQDLLTPRSAVSGARDVVLKPSRHLYFRLDLLKDRLAAWLDTRSGWPQFAIAEARGWLPGLRERCITRDLSWGVPAPRPGFEGKSAYVWFDAPIGYIAAAAEWAATESCRDWRRWWWEADHVRYVQFLGKDNVPFHAVSFPCTLLGSGEPWKTVDTIKAFHWLTWDGGKFSTSRKRGIFLDQVLDVAPADAWRWWLAANAPESADVDLDPERFVADVRNDLSDTFGNLVHRIVSFAARHAGHRADAAVDEAAEARFRALADAVDEAHLALSYRRATESCRALWRAGNSWWNDAAPWADRDPSSRAAKIRTGLEIAALACVVAAPFVPDAAARGAVALGLASLPGFPAGRVPSLAFLHAAGPLVPGSPPFPRLDEELGSRIRSRFGGA